MKLIPVHDSHARTIISDFIEDRFGGSGAEGLVLGLSGGLDSAVVLKLAADVVGPERIKAFHLPCGENGGKDLEHARTAAKTAGVELEIIDIFPMVDPLPFKMEGMVLGNAKARVRMLVLYTHANLTNSLVLGTSNKTELLLGYFTKYGDGAADLYPIGDLFKTQVISLAREIGVQDEIILKPPSPGLIDGQTDENEIGYPYPILDQVLKGYISSLSTGEILDNMDHSCVDVDQMDRSGFSPPLLEEDVERIEEMVRTSMHKRWSLAVPKIGPSTVGLDLRERW